MCFSSLFFFSKDLLILIYNWIASHIFISFLFLIWWFILFSCHILISSSSCCTRFSMSVFIYIDRLPTDEPIYLFSPSFINKCAWGSNLIIFCQFLWKFSELLDEVLSPDILCLHSTRTLSYFAWYQLGLFEISFLLHSFNLTLYTIVFHPDGFLLWEAVYLDLSPSYFVHMGAGERQQSKMLSRVLLPANHWMLDGD